MYNWLIRSHTYLPIANSIPPVGSLAEWQKTKQDLKQACPLSKLKKHSAHALGNTNATYTTCPLESSGSAQFPL